VRSQDNQPRIREFELACQRSGIPFTVQRRIILELVLGREDHPTADQVFHAVNLRQPGISRATVHRTLELLVKMGVITRTNHTGRAIRYDGRQGVHHHLVCIECEKVIDFDDPGLDSLEMPDTGRFGFQVIDHQVQLRGVCARCRARSTGAVATTPQTVGEVEVPGTAATRPRRKAR
jgi:Fur family peroxide stress response transcriptional regulator